MVDFIDIKNLFGIKKEIAMECDKDGNGKLEKTKDFDEISLFNQKMNDYNNEKLNKSSLFTAARDATFVSNKPAEAYSLRKSVDLSKILQITKHQKVLSMLNHEAEKRGEKTLDTKLAEYWAQKAEKIAKTYKVPEALLISIMGQETHGTFKKNINSGNGAGPMQVTTTAIKDFFPNSKGNWNDLYKQMNPKLLNDILSYKDSKGRPIRTPEALREACTKNDELGMKVGLLIFEMQYVKAVSAKKFGKASYANVPKAIKGLQDGSIKFTEFENKALVQTALENYNSVPNIKKKYAQNVVDSLATNGIRFRDLTRLIKKS